MLVGLERGFIATAKVGSVILLARAAGPAAVGIYSLALALGVWTGSLANFGLHYSVQAKIARGDPHWKVTASNALSASFTLAACLAVPAALVHMSIGGAEVGWRTAIVTGALVPTSALTHMLSGLVRGRNDFAGHLLGNAGEYVLFPILVAGLAFTGQLSGGAAVGAFVVAVWACNLIWLHRLGKGVNVRPIRPRRALASVSVGRYGAGFQLGEAGAARADLIVVAILATPETLGIYALVKQVVEAIMYVPRAGGAIVLNDAAGKKGTRRGRMFLVIAQSVITLPILLAPHTVLELVGGEEFASGAPALRVLAVAGIVWGWSFVRAHAELGRSAGRPATIWALTSALLVTFGASLGFLAAGLVGVAVGCLSAYSLATLTYRAR